MPRMIHHAARRPLFAPTALLASLLLFHAQAVAQTGAELLIRPFAEGENFEFDASAMFQAESEDDFGGDFQMNMYEASGRAREVREQSIPRIGFDLAYLDIESDIGLPERLTDQALGIGLALPDLYGFRGGFTVGVGYAGERPYGDANAWYGKATIAMGKKLDENTDLGVFLDYDGNRTFLPDVPLPGFAYRKRVEDRLILVAGVPLSSLEWTPDDRWKFEVFWTLVEAFDVRVTYTLTEGLNLFANYDTSSRAFHVDELEGENERLLFAERRAELGVQWEPRDDVRLSIAGGMTFKQEFSTGWDLRESDEITDIGDEPYVRAGFEMRF